MAGIKRCHQCGAEWTDKRTPGFREDCLACGVPLHCCANCRFYDANAAQWCREPQARDEKPRDPEQGNTCGYFLLAEREDGPPSASADADSPAWMRFEKKDPGDIFQS